MSAFTSTEILDFDAVPDSALLVDRLASLFLDVTPGTLAVWRCTGRHALPYLKIGRKVRYRMGDLRAWLNSRALTHTA